MELIPVLSTIILVATITTFILAIGAYILYKKREKKGEQYTSFRNYPVTAELVTPVPYPEEEISTPAVKNRMVERAIVEKVSVSDKFAAESRYQVNPDKDRTEFAEKTSDKFMKYTSKGYVSAREEDKRGALKWR